jgi:hypothetical protein
MDFMTEEQKLYQRIKEQFDGDLLRIENAASAGAPDLNWCIDGAEGWIELKIREHNRVLLRKFQYAWGIRRSRYGGKVFVVCSDNELYHVWRYPNIHVVTYNDKYVAIHNAQIFTTDRVSVLHFYLKSELSL